MYKIELTYGASWDAPVVEEHLVERAFHVRDIERLAQATLHRAQMHAKAARPTDYRIVDPLGRWIRPSTTRARRRNFARAGRTCWR